MKKNKIVTLIMAGLYASAFPSATHASEQPDASVLVKQAYGGIHYSYFDADNERLKVAGDSASGLEEGDGLGLSLGYRFSEYNELRILYTDLSVDALRNAYGDQDGRSVAIDLLHFPSKKNLYLIGGFKEIDLEDKEVSANIGMGYRHYFTNRFAGFIEGKGHYQFEDYHTDFNATIGLMYFFGENKARKPLAPAPKTQVVKAAPVQTAPQAKDADKDGVIDSLDQCPGTPATHMVDVKGCTLFSEKMRSIEVQVNFDNNSDVIKPAFYDEVEKLANFMKQYEAVNLTIEGHSSSVGAAAYNQTLSMKRAQAVVDMLVSEYGVDSARLTAVGYGEERLLNRENNAAAHAQNRRIMATAETSEKVAVEK
ncbi:OmpA family protein [Thalassotalea euphylliae]|uniref:OmpA family protein n=1 Tax=Thalassotalea euphylliae TaxID=1655234 RepID=A0A3E0TQF8_9GAMM|nr:OmpA family protein [Thalassotalea euphylliae]REL26769.1 OmpA family protein [Thalassotalea euphylliae]